MSSFCRHSRSGAALLLTALLVACGSGRETVQQPTTADAQKPAVAVGAEPVASTANEHVASPPVEAMVPEPQPSAPPMSAAALTPAEMAAHQMEVDKLCAQIGDKLSSVDTKECLDLLFRFGGGYSVNGRPLMFKDVAPVAKQPREFRVLLMGGVHGDEYSSISIVFKWLQLFSNNALEGEYYWRFAPLVNPDGLLDGNQAKRQNANGVDLNRNFPSEDWNATAVGYWQESTGANPRRFPGNKPGSEPEVQWIVQQMREFHPDVIVSVHAPYHLLDFDGPAQAPQNIGELYLHQLGVYPGSLGNYAGLNKSIPVVTLELPSAGIMPQKDQIKLMWKDLVSWLEREGRRKMQTASNP
jgi:hypothetical protein